MSDHDIPTTNIQPPHADGPKARPKRPGKRNVILGAGALGILALGFAGGAAAWSGTHGQEMTFDASLTSTPIAQLTDASSIGITGEVEQIYGNKFVLTDGAARALVETGRAGEGGKLVETGETVTSRAVSTTASSMRAPSAMPTSAWTNSTRPRRITASARATGIAAIRSDGSPCELITASAIPVPHRDRFRIFDQTDAGLRLIGPDPSGTELSVEL